MRSFVIAALAVCGACSPQGGAPPRPPGGAPPRPTMTPALASALPVKRPALTPGRAQWEPLPAEPPFLVDRVWSDDELRCALSRAGQVACWGRLHGNDGPADQRAGVSTPLVLRGVDGVTDVATQWFYLCVAQRDGAGGCFTLSDIGRPAPQFPEPPVELTTREYDLCARMRDGNVGCVDTKGKYTPVAGIAGATSLACTYDTCCALTAKAGVVCFGDEEQEIGIAESVEAKPIGVPLPPATAIAFNGDRACVRTHAGGAHCWGDAAKLSRPGGVRAVAAVRHDVCLLLDDGAMSCTDDSTPVSANVAHARDACVVHKDGSVSCRGENEHGELGDGHPLIVLTPQRVPRLDEVVDLRVAHTTSCAARRDGSLWCWGSAPLAAVGQLSGPLVWGQYIAGCRIVPPQTLQCTGPNLRNSDWSTEIFDMAGALPKIRGVAIHRDGSMCAVDDGGNVKCRHGMVNHGTDKRWVPLATPGRVEEIMPLATGFCARLADGRASCFIDERYDGDPKFLTGLPKATMKLVDGIRDASQLATGQNDACVLTKTAQVWCWNTDRPKPREVPALRGATWIAGNHLHLCAVVRGEVWCWGANDRGQLGDGTVSSSIERVATPVRARTSFQAVRVGVGRDSTCALDDKGQVWCWGADIRGELGQGRPLKSDTFVKVVGLGPR